MAKTETSNKRGLFLLAGTLDEKWIIKHAYHVFAAKQKKKGSYSQNDFLMEIIVGECENIIKKGV